MDKVITGGFVIALVIQYFVPLWSAFVSRQRWPQQVTGLITTGTSILVAALQELGAGYYSWTWVGVKAALLWAVAGFAHSKVWADPKDAAHPSSHQHLYAKVLAFPHKLPPGGVQPGVEPAMEDAA